MAWAADEERCMDRKVGRDGGGEGRTQSATCGRSPSKSWQPYIISWRHSGIHTQLKGSSITKPCNIGAVQFGPASEAAKGTPGNR